MTDDEKLRRAVDRDEHWGDTAPLLAGEVRRLEAENADLRRQVENARGNLWRPGLRRESEGS